MHIKIDKVEDNKRKVLFDDIISHHIDEEEIQRLLTDSTRGNWKADPKSGAAIGKSLYGLLNGSGGKLQALISEAGQTGATLDLHLDIPYEINALPFELANNNTFLLHQFNPLIHIVRRVLEWPEIKRNR